MRQGVTVEEMDPLALVDYIFERLALPKPGPLVNSIAPKAILKGLGIRTLDEITDDALVRIRSELRAKRII